MQTFREFFGKKKKPVTEAITVSHARYLRAHGKKAKGKGTWMFGNKEMGDIDHKDMHHAKEGTFQQAAASAKEWAKKNGYDKYMLWSLIHK